MRASVVVPVYKGGSLSEAPNSLLVKWLKSQNILACCQNQSGPGLIESRELILFLFIAAVPIIHITGYIELTSSSSYSLNAIQVVLIGISYCFPPVAMWTKVRGIKTVWGLPFPWRMTRR